MLSKKGKLILNLSFVCADSSQETFKNYFKFHIQLQKIQKVIKINPCII